MNIKDTVKEASVKSSQAHLEHVSEQIHLRGHVNIQIEERGVITQHFDGPNLIVTTAKKIMSYLLAEANAACTITRLLIAKDPQYDDAHIPLEVDPPLVGNTGLVGTPVTVTPDDPAFTYKPSAADATSVEFTFVLDYADGNGTGTAFYTEAGLFIGTTDNTNFPVAKQMFARETYPALIKNANRKVTFKWTIAF